MSPWFSRTMTQFESYLKRYQTKVDQALQGYLPRDHVRPSVIHKAMRYSVFAGGKRLRPILTMAAAEACGGRSERVLPAACALELIHTYSLIHDDLPSMDNDALRRGKPTNHVVFGEEIAILAGDALLTLAFDLLRQNMNLKGVKLTVLPRALEIITRGAGSQGMIAGQVADITSDKGRWKRMGYRALGHSSGSRNPGLKHFSRSPIGTFRENEFSSPSDLLTFIHTRKTAALISTSLELGGCLANGTGAKVAALKRFGEYIGLAFQVKDDILDQIGDKGKLGKTGSDKTNRKLTYPALYGLKNSERRATQLIEKAHHALNVFGQKGWFLNSLANYVLIRDK